MKAPERGFFASLRVGAASDNLISASLTEKEIEEKRRAGYVVEEDVVVSLTDAEVIHEENPVCSSNWALQEIHGDIAQGLGYLGGGVKVAVTDNKVDCAHWHLDGACVAEATFLQPEEDAALLGAHGTHVAGILHHVAPSASLLAVTVLNSTGSGWWSDGVKGITWAVAQGAKIINMSWGSQEHPGALVEEELRKLVEEQGITLIASAGNKEVLGYPAKFPFITSVAASKKGGTETLIASYQEGSPTVTAPGVNITSSVLDGKCATMSGTSMAAPHVAGVAALLSESLTAFGFPTIQPIIQSLLTETADDRGVEGPDAQFGAGMVRADEVVGAVALLPPLPVEEEPVEEPVPEVAPVPEPEPEIVKTPAPKEEPPKEEPAPVTPPAVEPQPVVIPPLPVVQPRPVVVPQPPVVEPEPILEPEPVAEPQPKPVVKPEPEKSPVPEDTKTEGHGSSLSVFFFVIFGLFAVARGRSSRTA